jgi:hypothetical protein
LKNYKGDNKITLGGVRRMRSFGGGMLRGGVIKEMGRGEVEGD